jgi:hypothetical protein
LNLLSATGTIIFATLYPFGKAHGMKVVPVVARQTRYHVFICDEILDAYGTSVFMLELLRRINLTTERLNKMTTFVDNGWFMTHYAQAPVGYDNDGIRNHHKVTKDYEH